MPVEPLGGKIFVSQERALDSIQVPLPAHVVDLAARAVASVEWRRAAALRASLDVHRATVAAAGVHFHG